MIRNVLDVPRMAARKNSKGFFLAKLLPRGKCRAIIKKQLLDSGQKKNTQIRCFYRKSMDEKKRLTKKEEEEELNEVRDNK